MKKILRVVAITSTVMVVILGAFLWNMNRLSKQKAAKQEKLLAQERDLLPDSRQKAIDKVEKVNIKQLYLSGDNKNVVTVPSTGLKQVYDGSQSTKAEEMLTTEKKNKQFSFDKPLWAYNPYGTNSQSMYLYFKSDGKGYCRYTVSVDDRNIADFTRTPFNGGAENVTKEHEYQIIGLLPGRVNYITVNFYSPKGELSKTGTWQITLPADDSGLAGRLSVEEGYSKQTISNGLYVVFADGRKGKDGKKHYAITMYDNSGILRANIPTDGYVGRNVQTIYDSLVVQSSKNCLVRINRLGQVTHSYPVYGYHFQGEYAYDGSAGVYLLATADRKNMTVGSKVLKIDMENKKVSQVLDMDTLLKSVYARAKKKGNAKNWISLDSIQCTGTNQLLLSSSKLSSVFKVSRVGSLLPSVDYIIADASQWKSYKGLKKKVLTKTLADGKDPDPTQTPVIQSILQTPKPAELFRSHYGQNSIVYTKGSGEGFYRLELLNNNAGKGAGSKNSSYYCRYLVDETSHTYQLQSEKALPHTETEGNVTVDKKVVIYCDSDSRSINETDNGAKLIRKYTAPMKLYRVYKDDWKGFWFY